MKRVGMIVLALVVLIFCAALLFTLNLLDGLGNALGARILRVGEWAGRLRERSG